MASHGFQNQVPNPSTCLLHPINFSSLISHLPHIPYSSNNEFLMIFLTPMLLVFLVPAVPALLTHLAQASLSSWEPSWICQLPPFPHIHRLGSPSHLVLPYDPDHSLISVVTPLFIIIYRPTYSIKQGFLGEKDWALFIFVSPAQALTSASPFLMLHFCI